MAASSALPGRLEQIPDRLADFSVRKQVPKAGREALWRANTASSEDTDRAADRADP
jgi:hypothetical protein